MGLLDDAIREHLELRRRAGADASEVARLEREALGPVVRGETPSFDPVPSDSEIADIDEQQLAIGDDPPAAHLPDELIAYDEATPPPAESYEQEYHDEGAALADVGGSPAHDEAPPRAAEEPPVPPAAAGQATEEYDVEAVEAAVRGEESVRTGVPEGEQSAAAPAPGSGDEPHAGGAQEAERAVGEPHPQDAEPVGGEPRRGEGEDADEDVLEQTPEFLQEAPEHDRLWFEQAPPKDFDFDR